MSRDSAANCNIIKRFLLNDNNAKRNGFIWNMLGSTLNAFQSVILLMILTRTVGLAQAGVYTIAYANANLFLYLGNYGMRNFQVSDVRPKYSFREYIISRAISVTAMLLLAFVFIMVSACQNNYSIDKTWIMIWMVIQKAIDSIENVFHGQYQRNERLDVAGRCMTIRMAILIVSFGVAVIISRNLLEGLIVSTLITFVVFLVFTLWTNNQSTNSSSKDFSWNSLMMLMWHCLPLCLGAFLSYYIGNAPKYAIDAILTSEEQACYGFIAMPVFVIGLLNNYIFMPQLHSLSLLWKDQNIRGFKRSIFKQTGIIASITVVCMLGAFLVGIPVLSLIYNTNLTEYRDPLVVLLLGGGFLAFTGYLSAVITIIRYQKYMLIGYTVVSLIAMVMSNRIVSVYGVMGASLFYTVLLAGLSVVFILTLVLGMTNSKSRIIS